ncbi:DUF6771 family protein [Sphingobium yanoikuyae]
MSVAPTTNALILPPFGQMPDRSVRPYLYRSLSQASCLCSLCVLIIILMNRPDSLRLAQSLLHAPGWARVALTAPNERMRENAALELAQIILAAWDKQQPIPDIRQMTFPI